MDFSTGIAEINTNLNLNAINEYNKFLQGKASFEFDKSVTKFDEVLEEASKSYAIKDKHDPEGLGNFVNQIGSAFGNSLNAVNDARIEANKLQEDVARGGGTSVHEAMIAAEKAALSMQMAIQVRNRMLSAYTDITGMAI